MLIHLPNPNANTGVFTIDLEYNKLEIMSGGIISFRSKHDYKIVYTINALEHLALYHNALVIIGKAMADNPEWFCPFAKPCR